MAKLNNQTSLPNISGTAYKPSDVRRSRIQLSGDSSTIPINVDGTTLIHTTTDYAFDEVFLWAANHDSSNDLNLTIAIVPSDTASSAAFSDATKTFVISVLNREGLQQIYPGVPHKSVSIYASTTSNDKVNIYGYVDRHFRIDLTDESLGYDGGGS
tara:strand:- start:1878 stop:2345 length:468 start_codon:yes stop_codon:yes gene_type:complete